jgi:hypothetical protein
VPQSSPSRRNERCRCLGRGVRTRQSFSNRPDFPPERCGLDRKAPFRGRGPQAGAEKKKAALASLSSPPPSLPRAEPRSLDTSRSLARHSQALHCGTPARGEKGPRTRAVVQGEARLFPSSPNAPYQLGTVRSGSPINDRGPCAFNLHSSAKGRRRRSGTHRLQADEPPLRRPSHPERSLCCHSFHSIPSSFFPPSAPASKGPASFNLTNAARQVGGRTERTIALSIIYYSESHDTSHRKHRHRSAERSPNPPQAR